MQRIRRSIILYVLLFAVCAAAADKQKDLEKRVDEILSQPDVARGFWGIEVVSLDSGKTLYSDNADKLFTPASNTKLFTTAAALALIGPEYKFLTTVETKGTVDKYGRLNGDLVLVGRGDPNLSGRTLPYSLRTERNQTPVHVLESLADQIAAKGIKVIDGDVVGDDTYFAFQRYGEGWSQNDLVDEWGAPVSALTINDNVIFISTMPGDRAGEKAFVSVTPYADYYRIDNRIITTPAGTGQREIYYNREQGSNQLTLWGSIPADDAGAGEALAIDDPADFAARLFRTMLERRGIVVYGSTKARHTELASLSTFSITTMAPVLGGGDAAANAMRRPVAPTAAVMASYQSQPLAQDLRVVNKVSQNLHAEILLRLLGRERGSNGSVAAGLEVLHGWLTQADIRPDEYTFYDGSGLSRQNLVTPHATVKLLSFVSKQPWADTYIDTLPVGGVDGTLSQRFKKSELLGRVHGKTGSLSHVSSLSGYATTVKGERLAFSIMANNYNLPSKKVLETIDQLLETIVAEGTKK